MNDGFTKTFLLSLAGALGAYLLAFVGHDTPVVGWISGAVVVVAFITLWIRSPSAGMAVLFTELVAGSLGRIFVFPGGVSVRMAIFAAALVLSIRSAEARARLKDDLGTSGIRGPLILIAIAVALGVLRGLRNPIGALVGDANAYAYLLLVVPLRAARRDARFRGRALGAVFGAATGCALLTLGAFFLFTHATPEPALRSLYTWVRDQGLGEITRAPGGFYRVFFQAHVWNVAVFLLGVPLILARDMRASRRHLWVATALSAAVVFVSFSRTFWLAAVAATAVTVLIMLRAKRFRPIRGGYALTLATVAVLGVAIPFLLSQSVGGASVARLAGLAGEAAADSRMNLLRTLWPAVIDRPILGWGFGRELTYETRDPRLLAYFPDGNYTTYAFEWGWLDFWFKMGLLGPVAFLFLVATVADRLGRSIRAATDDDGTVALAFLSVTAFLAVAHVFSPWLNHPLGIGMLLLAALWPFGNGRATASG